MSPSLPLLLFLFLLSVTVTATIAVAAPSSTTDFIFHGFHNAALTLSGNSAVEPSGLLRLTNRTKHAIGHAFFPDPFRFFPPSSSDDDNDDEDAAFSFSTSFVFAIVSPYPDVSSHGMAFALAPSKDLPGAAPSQFLSLFNLTTNDKPYNHILAVELDTVRNLEFNDINDDHVGINLNGLDSLVSAPRLLS